MFLLPCNPPSAKDAVWEKGMWPGDETDLKVFSPPRIVEEPQQEGHKASNTINCLVHTVTPISGVLECHHEPAANGRMATGPVLLPQLGDRWQGECSHRVGVNGRLEIYRVGATDIHRLPAFGTFADPDMTHSTHLPVWQTKLK